MNGSAPTSLSALLRPAGRTSGWRRTPAVAVQNMIATSHPVATAAGMDAYRRGGNAVDAALAAATAMTISEPSNNGVGGDMFAIVFADGKLYGLNGSGRSPAAIDGPKVDPFGPRSVTVPGAVRAWADLAERFGRLGLDGALLHAADLAETGVTCTARIATLWANTELAPWPAPAVGVRYRFPDLAATLRTLATEGPDGFYTGRIARAVAGSCWLSENDLAGHKSEWVTPLRLTYRGLDVCELPPNGQGAAALIALGLLEGLEPTLHHQIEATKFGLADAYAHIADGPLPDLLLDADHLAARRTLISSESASDPEPSSIPRGGTIYVCAVDEDGMAVSLIQSLYMGFGSGIVADGTGVVLQNRGACFVEEEGHPNQLEPAKRPFHTIIPAMLMQNDDLLGPFGVVGGAMQPQGHLQLVQQFLAGEDPQAALDAPRWRWYEGRRIEVEPGLADAIPALRKLGHDAVLGAGPYAFGIGQAILRLPNGVLVGGSDGRADGYAAGF